MTKILLYVIIGLSILCSLLFTRSCVMQAERDHARDKAGFVEGYYTKGMAQTSDKHLMKAYVDSVVGAERLREAGSVTEVNHVTSNTYTKVTQNLRDSFLFDTVPVKCISYDNGFQSLKGCWGPGVYPTMRSSDVLDVVFYDSVTKRLAWIIPLKKVQTGKVLHKDPNASYHLTSIRKVKKK